jgi:predicted small integral membrane protein
LRLIASLSFDDLPNAVHVKYFVGSVRGTTAVIEARIAKIVMIASLALFAFVVTFDNITDYDTNFDFVRHVLSMDTIFPGTTLLYRSMISPALGNFAYWLIILGEGITSLVLGIAAVALLRHLRSEGARFNRAKRFVFIGAIVGFLVWFSGFMVVGGEWFQMWQSQKWNGQQAAFRFYLTILAVLIFVNQEDGDQRRAHDRSYLDRSTGRREE